MNWVGGSRNRLVMKNDVKKQREFFAKRKLQQKLTSLGIAPPALSAGDGSSGSTDLLTLFVVNQIASTKTKAEPPKVAVFGRSNRSKHRRNEPLVLPMSPCSPSRLSLLGSPAQSSVQEIRKQRIMYQQLSPVLESAFSDNSASDYLPPAHGLPTSASPSSSSASGQGLFPPQMKMPKQSQTQSQPLPHYSSPPWDRSALQQAEFQPFSQPRGMTDPGSWSVRANPPPFQLETPAASRFLFGSPEPDKTKVQHHGGHSGPFMLNQLEPKQATLDFPISQSEPRHLFEEHVFGMFNDNSHGTQSACFGNACSKEYLKDESSVTPSSPQTVPNPQAVEMELSNGTDTSSTCLGQRAGLLKSFEYSPSCSCSAGYLSSDSNDGDPCFESCHQDSGFYLDEACSEHVRSPAQRITVLSPPRPLTPLMRSARNAGDNQNRTGKEAGTDRASGSQQAGSFTAPSSSPRPLGETSNSEMCVCRKTFAQSQDVETQTEYTYDTCDASTQCSFVANSEGGASGFTLDRPAVGASLQLPANERDTDVEPQALRAPSKASPSTEGGAPWSWWKSRPDSGSRVPHSITAENILQRPINPLHGVWSPRGEGNGDKREQTGEDEKNPAVKEVFSEGREGVTSASRGHTLSEEAVTLREIANVLLLLKQRSNDQK
ncbi:uncharacterized protein LOC105936307 [Fundulus heteroclitus]|uniref:uncharacterized protein LOC105936307 n=1 Tax=Fundulus heteroclitus TaxID=8078 RepID=UPI00165BABC9|nr:uncharacterized protein LOC105936307 [Fundulus heteroclitus]